MPVFTDTEGNPWPCVAEDCPFDRTDYTVGGGAKTMVHGRRVYLYPGDMNPRNETTGIEQYHLECFIRTHSSG
jgi:hypothetical protein